MKESTPTLLALAVLLVLAPRWEGTAATDSQSRCPKPGKYLVRNPQDCRSYYYCFEGEPFWGMCAAGHRFDERRQSCLPSTAAECFACPPTGVSSLANPPHCDRYVLCFQGVPHERVCPAGLLFNQRLGQCDLSGNVVCN